MTIDDIVRKVEGIKIIQQRRIDVGDTLREVGDALCLNVREAEFLLDIIQKGGLWRR